MLPQVRLLIAFFIYLLAGGLVMVVASIIVPELIDPTQTGKFIFFCYGVILLEALCLVHWSILTKGVNIRLTAVDILLGILFLYITVNRYWIQSVQGFSIRYYEVLALGAFYIVLRQLGPKVYPYILLSLLASGLIQAVYGCLQWMGYYHSNNNNFMATGSFFNPGPYAGFLASVLPVALGLLIYRQKCMALLGQSLPAKWGGIVKRTVPPALLWLPMGAAIAILAILPVSGSRAAWVAVAVSLLVCFPFWVAEEIHWAGKGIPKTHSHRCFHFVDCRVHRNLFF
ncbi:MAG: hypothetical protein ORN54_09060 [Cyclobacteriaceae bacterium]|nr:hypothetical protein [Cyclobacteriaceae bacterium]